MIDVLFRYDAFWQAETPQKISNDNMIPLKPT